MRMTSITAQARAVARTAPLATADLRNMLASDQAGDRVIGLSLAQDKPDARLFDLVAEAILHSRSAFEQYQALASAYEMAPLLDDSRRTRLGHVLDEALKDSSRGIDQDTSRRLLVTAIGDELESG